MEIKVDLSPEQINETIARAIAESAIGVELKRVIEKKVAELSRSYDNPIESVVSKIVGENIQKIVQAEFGEVIKARVREKVTEQFTTELFDKMWTRFVNNY